MTHAERLAVFASGASYGDLSEDAVQQLKIRVLDALGCAVGALPGEPIRPLRCLVDEFGAGGRTTLIGSGHTTADWAAFYNGALVRYLDFNDSYLAPGETYHPSDNVAPVLAAAERAGCSGRDFLAALAVAYQVQCRLSDVAPVRARGFDHTTQGAYAATAGISRALGLSRVQTAHALAIAGTTLNSLRVTRTGALSHWKGLAYPSTAMGAMHAALFAQHGITGPLAVFEGNKGFMETIAGPFEIDWEREDLERVTRTILKKYNAEIHSQSAIEAVLRLRREHPFAGRDVVALELVTFDVAYNIIGGGEEGDKRMVRTKEEADHSLPYLLAVAILDREVMPEQYRPQRILRPDVQNLLQRVTVRPSDELSRRFPAEMAGRITVRLTDGSELVEEVRDYEGFLTAPMSWETVVRKFNRLSGPYTDGLLREQIADVVAHLESLPVSELTRLLARARIPDEWNSHVLSMPREAVEPVGRLS